MATRQDEPLRPLTIAEQAALTRIVKASSERADRVRRALAGQHPQSQAEIITWLEDTVAAWNEDPTPFVWGGKRRERRLRARQRRLGGSPAVPVDPHSIAA